MILNIKIFDDFLTIDVSGFSDVTKISIENIIPDFYNIKVDNDTIIIKNRKPELYLTLLLLNEHYSLIIV